VGEIFAEFDRIKWRRLCDKKGFEIVTFVKDEIEKIESQK
jgi:hypothetical protein